MTVAMPYPGYPYGYNPYNVEALNRSIGGDAPPDLKETFNVGPIDPPPRPLEEMDDDDERAVYAPNLWPDEVCPTLRPALEAHYRSMAALAARLMDVFAVALGLPDRWFAPYIDRHGSALRVAHYPALDRPPQPGQLRAGAHTDYGTLTDPRHRRRAGPPGAGRRRHLDRRRPCPGRTRRQPRRPDAALDERPLALDHAPRRPGSVCLR